MDLKEPLSIEQQVERLKEHGMTDVDETKAKELLSEVSYYRLSGYTMQFRKAPNDSDFVNNQCCFSTVCRLYEFDEEMRNLLRKYIEKVELHFRMLISYHFSIAKCAAPPHDQHYDRNNYYAKEYFDKVMESFQKQKDYYKDSPIAKHHQQKYKDKYPLWVMTEMLSFSNLSKLYSSMYFSEKDLIANAAGTNRDILVNHLHCMSVLRNKCAHAGRLYNTVFNPPVRLSTRFLRKNKAISNSCLFAYIIVLVKRLPNEKDKSALIEGIDQLIKQYQKDIDMALIGFPNNYKEVLINNK